MKKQQESQIELLKKEIEEWKGKYLRALADYQNLEKRVSSERQHQAKYAAEKIIYELLNAYDTLEAAKKHIKNEGLRLGVEGFWTVLAKNGVTRIEAVGKKFDPHLMECVEVVESEKEGEVVEEVRAGYKLEDKMIRVAQVKVGKKDINQKAEELAKEQLQKGDYM